MIETQFEKEKLTQIITEDLKKIEERDKILKSLRETNESLAKDLEKDSYSHEFISRTNSISDNIDVIDQPYRLDSSELEMKKVDLRLETTLPEQLIENIYQDIEESQIKYKKKSKTLNIEKIDEEKENSLVSDKKNFENKQFGKEKNVEILPNKLIVSNAGEIEDDSDVEDEKDNFGSNAGEIYSDSDKSLEKNESFEAYESVSKEVEIPYDTKDFSEEIQILTGNTQKFDPKAMKEYEETEEFEEQTTAVQQVKNQSSEYSREQIAKMIGINPKIHQNYLYLVDNFLNFSLSASWVKIEKEGKTFYKNSKTNETSENDPKVAIFSKLFFDLKTQHFRVFDKIVFLFSNSKSVIRENHQEKIESAFEYDKETFELHKLKMKKEILDENFEEEKEKSEIPASQREIRKQRKLMENYLEKVIENRISADKNKKNYEDPNDYKKIEKSYDDKFDETKKFEKSSDVSFAKSTKEGFDFEKSLWNSKQGIDHIQNRAILKENSKTVSGFHFLEGPILGEHYFERNNGVSLDENLNERVFFI